MLNELAKARKAAAAVEDAAARLESARGELREAIVAADAAACTLPTIAEAVGVSKQRVHQIVAQAREQESAAAERASRSRRALTRGAANTGNTKARRRGINQRG
jgi:DNA-directed RNA polymerase sigma subunit (sigma70/sigma32)